MEMIHPPQDSASSPIDSRRLTARQSAEYFLNIVRLLDKAVDRDLVTTLTFLSIARANMRVFTTDPARAMRYAAMDAVPPDSERTPVTVYAIAKELGIPYETVRRHAAKLRKEGLCEAVPGGLIIPNSAFLYPGMLEAVSAHWALTQDLVNSAGGSATPISGDPLGMSAVRWCAWGQLLPRRPGPDRPYPGGGRPGRPGHARGVLRQYRAARLRSRSLSRRAGGPLRRRAGAGLGLCRRQDPEPALRDHAPPRAPPDGARPAGEVGGGVIVPERVSARPQVLAGIGELTARTEAYLARLAELGVRPTGV
uniref:Rrf2 family transcriptional regulator n=1 Tax=Phenylobacterium glaciei TaxID=2803784 RepID=A0A974P3H3_9CAUL|nr:Rrf2 family transcriptional regulator [Phenylobacterium glaciei]